MLQAASNHKKLLHFLSRSGHKEHMKANTRPTEGSCPDHEGPPQHAGDIRGGQPGTPRKGTQGRPEPTKHSAKSNHQLLPPPDIQNYNLVPSNRILNYKWARDDLRIGQSSQSSNTSLAAPHHYSWLLLFLDCSRTGQSPSSRSFLGSQRSLTHGPTGPLRDRNNKRVVP